MRLFLVIAFIWLSSQPAGAEECDRAALAQIVAQASKALTIMNKDKTASFQLRLKELKMKRGWSDAQLLKNAVPFIKNNEVSAFDVKTRQIYTKITALGKEAAAPSCMMRDKLNELLDELVQNNVEKWALVIDRVEAELAK